MTWNLLSDSYVSKQETIIDGFATKLADTSHHLNTDAVMDKDGKKDQDTGVCVCVCVCVVSYSCFLERIQFLWHSRVQDSSRLYSRIHACILDSDSRIVIDVIASFCWTF